MFELIKIIDALTGTVEYEPFSMADTSIFVGIPPVELRGVESVRAYRTQSKAKLFNSLSGGGAHVSNRNINGFLEIVVAPQSPAHAVLQIADISGIAFPVNSTDSKAVFDFAMSSSARVVLTPTWRKARYAQLVVYTLACKNLAISGGVRKRIKQ
jgi:hypothetical protein